MTQQHDETFLALQDEIAKLYHQGPKPQPSAQLDEAILAQAQTELSLSQSAALTLAVQNQDKTNVVSIKGWRQYRWQLSSAASVVLVAGLFMMMPMKQHYNSLELNPSGLNSSDFEALSLDMPVADNQANDITASAALKSAPMSSPNSTSPNTSAAPMSTAPQLSSFAQEQNIVDTHSADDRFSSKGSSQTSLSQQAEQANETAKVVEQVERSRQQKMMSELKPSEHSELTQVANNQYLKDSGMITLDTADKAMLRLTELVKLKKLSQAERYMLTMEQRFPELNNLNHPLHEDYNKIKQQLTVK
jgi:hypothetical protein